MNTMCLGLFIYLINMHLNFLGLLIKGLKDENKMIQQN